MPVNGIQIPYWLDCLRIAVRTANATGMVFMGADIFLHPEKGPMIAEVNGYPGLSIQLANRAGLLRRLTRLEGIEAENVNHAVKIGQSLFATSYPSFSFGEAKAILSTREEVLVYGYRNRQSHEVAQVNSGRLWSAIAEDLASELKLSIASNKLGVKHTESGSKLPLVRVKLKLRDKIIETQMMVSKRLSQKTAKIQLGRRDLRGFFISTEERI